MKPVIPKSAITKVYAGRPGCACGCRGNYSETQRSIAIIYGKYVAASEDAIDTAGSGIVFWDSPDGQRTYTIYFTEEAS